MKYVIKRYPDILNRCDVRYNLTQEESIKNYWEIEDLKELIVRDPMCYGFQYCKKGVPMVRISDLGQPFIDFTNIAYVSDKIHNKYNKTQLEKMDILMSVRGVSIGKIGIYLGEYKKANISPNIIIIRLANKELAPYVCMVLISKKGQDQISRFIAGSSKPTITAPLIGAIKIPKISSEVIEEINNKFWNAYKIKKEAIKKENCVKKEFKSIYSYYENNSELTFVKNLNEESRWDPHYHNPRYSVLRKGLEKLNCKVLSELCENVDETIENKNNSKKIGYIEISDVNNLNAQIENIKVDYLKKLPVGQKIIIKDKYLLIPKVRPYRNANTIYLQDNDKDILCTVSKNAFSVFSTANNEYPFYILAFLRSIYGFNQIVMAQSGTSYPTVNDDDIKCVKIPIISNVKMKQINNDYEYYMRSKQKESQLIKEIVSLIDNLKG